MLPLLHRAGAAVETDAEVLLSAVKPPFAEALTLKPLWLRSVYGWPDRSGYRRRRRQWFTAAAIQRGALIDRVCSH